MKARRENFSDCFQIDLCLYRESLNFLRITHHLSDSIFKECRCRLPLPFLLKLVQEYFLQSWISFCNEPWKSFCNKSWKSFCNGTNEKNTGFFYSFLRRSSSKHSVSFKISIKVGKIDWCMMPKIKYQDSRCQPWKFIPN